MKITVKLFANLRELAPEQAQKGQWQLDLQQGGSLTDALKEIGFTAEQKETVIIMVNGRVAKEDQVLKNGDEVSVFPPLAGG